MHGCFVLLTCALFLLVVRRGLRGCCCKLPIFYSTCLTSVEWIRVEELPIKEHRYPMHGDPGKPWVAIKGCRLLDVAVGKWNELCFIDGQLDTIDYPPNFKTYVHYVPTRGLWPLLFHFYKKRDGVYIIYSYNATKTTSFYVCVVWWLIFIVVTCINFFY